MDRAAERVPAAEREPGPQPLREGEVVWGTGGPPFVFQGPVRGWGWRCLSPAAGGGGGRGGVRAKRAENGSVGDTARGDGGCVLFASLAMRP